MADILFKGINQLELLPNIVFDLVNFINAIISTSNIFKLSQNELTQFVAVCKYIKIRRLDNFITPTRSYKYNRYLNTELFAVLFSLRTVLLLVIWLMCAYSL